MKKVKRILAAAGAHSSAFAVCIHARLRFKFQREFYESADGLHLRDRHHSGSAVGVHAHL